LVDKLKAAGVNTVESLADMTPEQLEAIEGIGPKTVEKISIAVNNYFASLDGGEAVATAEPESTEEAASEAPVGGEPLAEGLIEEGSSEADALAAEPEPAEGAALASEGGGVRSEEPATAETATEEAATDEAPDDKQN
jgi:N utilization substance protein A